MCIGDSGFCAISWTMILVSMIALRSMNWNKVVQATCLSPRKASFGWKSTKLMALKGYTFYGLWSIVPRQVQTCIPLHVDSCMENKKQPQEYHLDFWLKTCNSWVAGVKFLCETVNERAQSAKSSTKKDISKLHAELGHTSEAITHATSNAIGIHVTGTSKPCEECTLGKSKKGLCK